MTTPFVLEQVFDVPIEKVWHVMTDTGKMKEWYFPALLKFESVVGYKFVFTHVVRDKTILRLKRF